eukprot:Blabericola_migrator_1__9573@NODE_521_length_7888_cov_123_152538_g398_i0_p3_GENE_NODE_521_length_7888_cov_123_152538_g398_i0NODE_521_length_7888_cov_123_152538_g398_i0_p3_ORF_typecomplete_len420_score45_08DUF155/PF02582_14/1e26_NODE_521_length_7888_cov_123_152538_g398_i064087667
MLSFCPHARLLVQSYFRLVKSIATTLGYNLVSLYSHLVEEGHQCTWFDERSALHFELSHRTWREKLLNQAPLQRSPGLLIEDNILPKRLQRSRSADAEPPGVKNWLQESNSDTENKIDCFVFASGAVIIWGLKPQVRVRTGAYKDALVQNSAQPNEVSQLEQIRQNCQANTSWNNNLVSATVWFLSQFADSPIRPDWISEDYIHYSEGQGRPLQPRDKKGRRRHVERISNNRLYLKTDLLEEKFAASLALQQHIILGIFEETFDANVKSLSRQALGFPSFNSRVYKEDTRWEKIQAWLLGQRPRALEDSKLIQKLADLYVKMIDVNLVQKIGDVPEYFWEHPENQRLWRSLHVYLEVPPRISILNNRCSWTQQLLTDLTHSSYEARSAHMTWVCIFWIVVYCIVELAYRFMERRPVGER